MQCHKVKKQLVLYVGNDLPAKKKISVESHLENCPTCMAKLEELEKMKQGLHTIAQSDSPDALRSDFPEQVTRLIGKEPEGTQPKPVLITSIAAVGILLIVSAFIFFLSPSKVSPERLAKEILAISEKGGSELVWDPENIFFKACDGPHRLDTWDAPKQSGVYAVLHKSTSDEGLITYIIDYCGQGRKLSSYKGYPWIRHRMKRLVARTGSADNVYVAVFLMPDSSKQQRRQIEKALLKAFNPYFNRGV